MRDDDDKLVWAVCVLVGLMIFVTVLWGIRSYRAERDCLAHGYPDSKITMSQVYCIKRVNQTDEVVPLSRLK